MDCDHLPAPPAIEKIIVEDRFKREIIAKDVSDFPDSIREARIVRKCGSANIEMPVPVAKIIISTVDRNGNLVSAENATLLTIEYFDSEGNWLQTDHMRDYSKRR